MNVETAFAHSNKLRAFGRLAAAIVVLAAPVGCIIEQSSPAPTNYSPEDFEVTPPGTPTIDLHFDKVFAGVSCTPNTSGGISTWFVEIDNTSSSTTNPVSCWDTNVDLPYIVAFEGLQGDTVYTMTATGYLADGTACYVASCSAHTMPGPHAVLPSCSLAKTC